MVDLEKKLKSPFKIGKTRFPNPIWLASGTCGFGEELSDLIDLNLLGGICLKGTTLKPKNGNSPPRIVETPSGLLNAIGLQNPGIKVLIEEKIPFLRKWRVPIIVNFSGETIEEYAEFAKILSATIKVEAVEINISCPNVKKGGMAFGTDPLSVEKIVKKVKQNTPFPVIAKLSPNVTDITQIAKAAQNGGADALSLINTVLGMAFDIQTQAPKLANKMGGLSGPAIKPIAIRMVYQVRQVTRLPIIGIGGINSVDDIFEFFCAGADAVQIGTLTFRDINRLKEIIQKANPACHSHTITCHSRASACHSRASACHSRASACHSREGGNLIS